MTVADIRQHAARKRPAQGAEPLRPPKRPQVAPLSELAGAEAEPGRASDRKPIIALSVPTVPNEVPSEEPSIEGAASPEGRAVEESIEGAPAAQPTEEVRAEARESEQPASTAAAPSGGTQSGSSMPSLSDVRAWVSA